MSAPAARCILAASQRNWCHTNIVAYLWTATPDVKRYRPAARSRICHSMKKRTLRQSSRACSKNSTARGMPFDYSASSNVVVAASIIRVRTQRTCSTPANWSVTGVYRAGGGNSRQHSA
jgi:hypothetical protein